MNQVALHNVDFSTDIPCIREDFVSFINASGELLKKQIEGQTAGESDSSESDDDEGEDKTLSLIHI